MNAMSIVFGILPESLFFTLFVVFAKRLKTHRIALFFMVFGLNLVSGYLFSYTVYYHICFMVVFYFILYGLYKSHVIDVFLITSVSLLLIALSAVCYFLLIPLSVQWFGRFDVNGFTNYYLVAFVNRMLLFVMLYGIRNKLSFLYQLYIRYWDRTEGNKVKSITIRNVSCVLLNGMIYVLHIFIIYRLSKM